MDLSVLGRRKFEKLAEEMLEKFEGAQTVDMDFRTMLLRKVRSIFENGDLPTLDAFLEFNETSDIIASYFNNLQDKISESLRDYQGYIYNMGIDINNALDEIVGSNSEVDRNKEQVNSLVKNIESAVINNSDSKSIHDEILMTIDFKDKMYTSKESDVDISRFGAITLPSVREVILSPSDLSFKVEHPYDAIDKMKFTTHDVTGIADNRLFLPGHKQGKFFGLITELNDIRMESNIDDILNNLIDRPWEVEYVTDGVGNRLRISMIISFIQPVTLNTILMDSMNDVEAYYKDMDTDEYVSMYDYFNEWYTKVKTDTVKYIVYGNTPEEVYYNVLSLVKNNNVIYTYSYVETMFRKKADMYNKYLIDYEVKPIPEVEISSAASEEKLLEKRKYRTAVMIDSLQHLIRDYATKGVYITNEIQAGEQIRTIELYTSVYIPSGGEEMIKYEVSFDGKTWYPIRSLSDSVTQFNSAYPTRIVLGESGNNPNYTYLPDLRFKTFYLKVILTTTDITVTPAVYSLKARVKH